MGAHDRAATDQTYSRYNRAKHAWCRLGHCGELCLQRRQAGRAHARFDQSGIYMDQLIGRKEVRFDWSKFKWLGTPEQTESVFLIRGDSPYKSLDDVRKGGEPPKCGSTG